MNVIYEPKGKAREYSPLALNYYRGCDHACSYCYAKRLGQKNVVNPRKNIIKLLEKDLAEKPKIKKQILLSFMGDPYCVADQEYKLTPVIIKMLLAAGWPVAVLSKGGKRCLRDISLYSGDIKIGATLTFYNTKKSLDTEPGAAPGIERIETLKTFHDAGVKTFVSIEPVIDPDESLACIRESLEYVDQYKIGKLNHVKNDTDWEKFCIEAVELCRSAHKQIYVKDDLRLFAPRGFLRPEECDADSLALKAK